IDTAYLLDTLKQAIRLNSIVPREEPVAAYFAEKIRELGIEPEWHEVAPGRPNVYASIDLGPSERFLTLTGHTDTVDVAANWPTDPFDPVIDGDRLYGLGSMDMKAGCVCALAAFKALLEAKEVHGTLGRLGLAFTVDEEAYGLGARALLATDYARSDAMLLGEPTFGRGADGTVGSLHLGLTGKVLYKVVVTGRMAHGFYPERGINAVEDAGRIIAALERLNIGVHPEFGSGNYSILKVEGGYKEYAIVVPERCEMIITRLTVPGETRESAVADLRALVDSLHLASTVEITTPPPFYEPYLLDRDSRIMADFEASYRSVLGEAPRWQPRRGIEDANIYVAEGNIPTITFGPAGVGPHEAGEYVQVSTLEPTARVYVETAQRFLRA
ncbi:MAG: M20/M25/M40 family metallo-hydrolase, partial [Caldilinea sp.]|nr:M20/M25/M40 family metallo-hydrolase [Caldilinea sp.]